MNNRSKIFLRKKTSGTMDLDSYINDDESITYEYELQKDPTNLLTWTRYLDHVKNLKKKNTLELLCFLYERCCYQFPASHDVWNEYLTLRVSLIRTCNPVLYSEEFDKVNKLFEKCLYLCYEHVDIWTQYLKFLTLQSDLKSLRVAFNNSLCSLPLESHAMVWTIMIDYIRDNLLRDAIYGDEDDDELEPIMYNALTGENSGQKTAKDIDYWSSHLLLRYIPVCPNEELEDIINLIFMTKDYSGLIPIYEEYLIKSSKFALKNSSMYKVYANYLTLLEHSSTPNKYEDVLTTCIREFPEQRSELILKLVKYNLKNANLAQARNILQESLEASTKMKEFSVLYDFYVGFEEVYLEVMIAELQKSPEKQTVWEDDLKYHMRLLEQLLETHPLQINDLKLRQNINDVKTWIARAELFPGAPEKANVFAQALSKINPTKVDTPGILGDIWCRYAKLYISTQDYDTAREIFDRATRVPYSHLIDLEDVWICWAEMELDIDGLEKAVLVIKTALKVPQSPELVLEKYQRSKKRELPAQTVVFSSLKLWSFYLDLLESTCDNKDAIPSTRAAYEQAISLKIATPLIFINYAHFLQEQKLWEESFKIYERAIDTFPSDTSFEIWNIYLAEGLKNGLSKERMRDLFEQALKLAQDGLDCKPFYTLYSDFEEKNGLTKRSVDILHRGCKETSHLDSKCTLWELCIYKCKKLLGDVNSRELYEECIQDLPNSKSVKFSLDFAVTEASHGDFERARAILNFGAQLLHPSTNQALWDYWNEFELRYGSKDSYKEMLRIKREISETFSVDTELVSQQKGNIAFVSSSTVVGGNQKADTSTLEKEVANPEEIELDL